MLEWQAKSLAECEIFRYTAAASANGLDMCLMVGGSDSAVDSSHSTKCAQAASNLPCISSPCNVCRTYLKFTVVLRYIGEQKDHPAMWQTAPLPAPLTLGQFLVQTGWGILKVCLLEQTVDLLDCSLKLTENASSRDILSYWAGVVHEDQNECGYLTLGEKVLVLADMNGFGPNMTEDDLGIFVGPPSWKNKRMDPGRVQILFSRLGSQQIHSCCQFAIYTPKLLLVCLHWELAGKTYEQ